MTREKIEDIRFIVIPFVVNILKGINYEGQGDSDAKEFIDDFNVIFDLAIKALEQEPILDKIYADIEVKLAEPLYQHEEEDWKDGLIMALEIIDKCKAEKEG